MAMSNFLKGEPLVDTLINAAVATGAGPSFIPKTDNRAYQVIIETTATCALQGSLDGTNWITLRTSTASEGYSTAEPWKFVRGNVTAWTSGTVTLLMGT